MRKIAHHPTHMTPQEAEILDLEIYRYRLWEDNIPKIHSQMLTIL